ncbi:MAG: AP2 domain-containing protein [Planctomycetota bacterium]
MTTIQIKVPNWLDKICTWPVVWYRKKWYGDPFRKIPLGQGLFSLVSLKDFYWLNNYRWCAKGNNKRVYAARFDIDGEVSKTISMHRQIMNAPKGILVDHRNRDSLDNRRDNLRFATPAQNMCNRRKRKNTSSQYIGVYFDNRIHRWVAKIFADGKRIWLGCFLSELDAAHAYDIAARKYHKDFANLNFTP